MDDGALCQLYASNDQKTSKSHGNEVLACLSSLIVMDMYIITVLVITLIILNGFRGRPDYFQISR